MRTWFLRRPWVIWAIGYPCAMFDGILLAHSWALRDVQMFISECEKEANEERDDE